MVAYQEYHTALCVHTPSEFFGDIICSTVDDTNLVSVYCDDDVLSLDA
jgi:hypothetical protein